MPIYNITIHVDGIEANDEVDAREHALKLLRDGDMSAVDTVHVMYVGEVR